MTEAPKTVTVGCRIVNGLTIRHCKPGYDDGTGSGYRPVYPTGPAVHLNGPSALHAGANNHALHDKASAQETEVDETWFAEWLKQNEKNPIVTQGMVYLVKPEG